MSLNYSQWMNRALVLAKQAWGKTSPNPMVGAVIVRDGKVVGEGYHQKAGEHHAEVNAINSATEELTGAEIYVTLEPCSTTGRTPPCTEAIIRAGLKRVIIGAVDPNPNHAGRGIKILEDAGIEVVTGVETAKCEALNESFFHWITTGKPLVLLKMAMTIDGKIATDSGQSQWITGSDARERVQYLRQWADAIIVGGETVRKDTPSLTVRSVDNWDVQPRRIVASRSLTPADLGELMPAGVTPELIAPANAEEWHEYFKSLALQQITSVLVEGGGELAAVLLESGVVDRVEFHIAPKILGGRNSRPVVGGENPSSLADAYGLVDLKTELLGNDIAVSARVERNK